MKADDPNLKPQYRMPRVFGALAGPRNVPRDKQHLPNNETALFISATVLTDEKLLAELLPPDCALEGEPLLTVTVNHKSNVAWLAGRSYAILSVTFNIAHESRSQGRLAGVFMPVLWENHADPIMTGREELGFAKIYAEIPPPVIIGDRYSAAAAWDGFRFFDIEVGDLAEAPATPPPPAASFHYKFIPCNGALGEADTEYLAYAPPGSATGYGGMRITHRWTGTGTFRFHRARWEDVPFQYPIINALAALPCRELRSASVSRFAAEGPIGNPSAGSLVETD